MPCSTDEGAEESKLLSARRDVTGVSIVDGNTQSLTIDATVVGFDPNTIVLYNTEAAGNFMIRDSTFRNSNRFGLFIKAQNVMVLGNTFQGNLEAAIFAVNEPGFPEGHLAERLHVQGNSFDDNARSLMSQQRFFLGDDPADVVVGVFKSGNNFATGVSPLSNVKILDNVFDNWRGMAISVRNSRDVAIMGNTFNLSTDDTAMRQKLDQDPLLADTDSTGRYAAIYLIDNNGVRIADNTFDHRNAINGDADDQDLDVAFDSSNQHVMGAASALASSQQALLGNASNNPYAFEIKDLITRNDDDLTSYNVFDDWQ